MAINLRDVLWKGVIEDTFDDFLHFFFKDADKIFDFKRGFEFLDKELEQLFPTDEMNAPRFVDKLAKVFTLDGKEEWVLIHCEVQGYSDKDFARRLFTYFYRILDRYNKPVSTIAIFTDRLPQKRTPGTFHYGFLGTECMYKFNTYKVAEQDETQLEASNNPFAVAIHTALIAQDRKKLGDEGLYPLKYALVKKLLQRKFKRKKIESLLNFIHLYLQFDNSEISSKFDTDVYILTEKTKVMGLKELVLETVKKEGEAKGEARGLAKGEAKLRKRDFDVVKNLIVDFGFNDEQAARAASVSIPFVQNVRNSLKKKN